MGLLLEPGLLFFLPLLWVRFLVDAIETLC